jgi:hypothetical protein
VAVKNKKTWINQITWTIRRLGIILFCIAKVNIYAVKPSINAGQTSCTTASPPLGISQARQIWTVAIPTDLSSRHVMAQRWYRISRHQVSSAWPKA